MTQTLPKTRDQKFTPLVRLKTKDISLLKEINLPSDVIKSLAKIITTPCLQGIDAQIELTNISGLEIDLDEQSPPSLHKQEESLNQILQEVTHAFLEKFKEIMTEDMSEEKVLSLFLKKIDQKDYSNLEEQEPSLDKNDLLSLIFGDLISFLIKECRSLYLLYKEREFPLNEQQLLSRFLLYIQSGSMKMPWNQEFVTFFQGLEEQQELQNISQEGFLQGKLGSERRIKLDIHKESFDGGAFLKYFLLNLSTGLTGLISIIPFGMICKYRWPFIHNYFRNSSFTHHILLIIVGICNMLYLFSSNFPNSWSQPSLFVTFEGLLFYCVWNAFIRSHQSGPVSKLIKSVQLSDESIESFNTLSSSSLLSSHFTDLELNNIILRSGIDPSKFSFRSSNNTTENLKSSFSSELEGIIREGDEFISDQKFKIEDTLYQGILFEKKVFNKRFRTAASPASGKTDLYTVCLDLLKIGEIKYPKFSYFCLFLLNFAFIPLSYRLDRYMKTSNIAEYFDLPSRYWVPFENSSYALSRFSSDLVMLGVFWTFIQNELTRYQILKKIGKLMHSEIKLDPQSLESWCVLRKIFKDFGAKQRRAMSWSVFAFIVYQFVIKLFNMELSSFFGSLEVLSLAILAFFKILLHIQLSQHSSLLKESKRKALMVYESYEKSSSSVEGLRSELLKDVPSSELITHKEELKRAYDDAIKEIEEQDKGVSLMTKLIDFEEHFPEFQSYFESFPNRVKL